METITENNLELVVEDNKSKALAIKVTNDIELHEASDFLTGIKKTMREVEDFFNPMVEAAHKAHKEVCDKRNLFLKPLKDCEAFIKGRMGQYQIEQDRKRREAQEKAEAEAREKEQREREKLLKKAQEEEAKGNADKAEALLEKAEEVYVAPKPVEVAVSRPENTSVRYAWDAEVTDKKIVPLDYMTVDVQRLSKMATASKGQFTVPGIRFVKRAIVVQKVG